ncbi:IclR family transcriptional regulator domain-containing protein [Streptacidiphilus cavernicola]|uniref:IclR family transcriptional regulator C-terminal domain-containing protein n=1 Tax=Streptacidiphilus cavernicola TaxID=3342716 RepID=A0ABV6VWB5_9ACTN
MPQMPPTSADASVGPLDRGLAVLRALAHAPGGRMRASDLARATGLARSPVDRIATTLVRLGYLREEDRELVLAPRLIRLGSAYLRSSGLPGALAGHTVLLADELDESVSLAVPDRDAVRFVTQATRRRALSVSFRIGDALPAERCAPGAIFASGWDGEQWAAWSARHRADPEDAGFPAVPGRRPGGAGGSDGSGQESADGGDRIGGEFPRRAAEAAERGWAVDDQLIEPGLVAVAVPVRDRAGRLLAALSAVSHTSRHSADSLRDYALPALLRTAERMTEALAEETAAPPSERDGTTAAPTLSQDPSRDTSLDPKRELGPEYLQSLARGLAVLAALGDLPGGMTLSAVAQATALPRATARRSLLTLQQLGYVTADERLFSPLPQVLDLGYPLLSALPLGELAQPHLAALVRRVHDSASVAVLDRDDIRYVGRVAAGRIMSVSIAVGTRFPAHATAMGRVLLAGLSASERQAWLERAELKQLTDATVTDRAQLAAELDRTARDGFALVDQELEEGLRSIAVPLHGRDGRVLAAANVSLHAGRTSLQEARETILPALREAAAAITADIALVSDSSPLALD